MQVLGQESLAFPASTGASFILAMLCTGTGKAYLGWLDPNILI
jgi:DNA-binding IclR family transcriptional regulator